jgi:hypothetical protein
MIVTTSQRLHPNTIKIGTWELRSQRLEHWQYIHTTQRRNGGKLKLAMLKVTVRSQSLYVIHPVS